MSTSPSNHPVPGGGRQLELRGWDPLLTRRLVSSISRAIAIGNAIGIGIGIAIAARVQVLPILALIILLRGAGGS